ncbi:MAG: FAD-dependent oxidoreductase, partial [Dokdonella sp.]
RAVEAAGATLINTGIGWHEARVPTIATSVPRGAFAGITARLKPEVGLPLIATNRINMPDVAERILASGDADMVSMARPLLADPEWVNKARSGRADRINSCIACNQACLDHVFQQRTASCLVNPRACHETEWQITPASAQRRYAVVGAGPAGLAAATTLAQRGHAVTLYDQARTIGGQFDMARRIPGKEEFDETLRYFRHRLSDTGVTVRLGTRATAAMFTDRSFDAVIVATGVTPRALELPGNDDARVLSYIDVLRGNATVGTRVAIIGAGGIGFDVAEYLVEHAPSPTTDIDRWTRQWGVDLAHRERGGLVAAVPEPPDRAIWLLQRTAGTPGKRLNKTTGWVHRATLKSKQVQMLGDVGYERFDGESLHITVGGRAQSLRVDHVVVCAGQVPNRGLADELTAIGVTAHVIGGADIAAELDAKRAIAQGTRLAMTL